MTAPEPSLPSGAELDAAIVEATAGRLPADRFAAAFDAATLLLAVTERTGETSATPYVVQIGDADHGVAFSGPRHYESSGVTTPFAVLRGGDLVRGWPAGLGLAVNPGGDPSIVFSAAQLTALFGTGEATTVVPAGSEMRVGAPDPGLPPQAVDVVRRLVAADPSVRAAYQLAVAVGDGPIELVVGVEPGRPVARTTTPPTSRPSRAGSPTAWPRPIPGSAACRSSTSTAGCSTPRASTAPRCPDAPRQAPRTGLARVDEVTDLHPLELPTDDWAGWLSQRVDTLLAASSAALDPAHRRHAPRDRRGALALGRVRSRAAVGERRRRPAERGAPRPRRSARWPRTAPSEVSRAHHRPRPRPRAVRRRRRHRPGTVWTSRRRRFRERVLRDFRRSGVDRSEDDRARLRAIAERLTVLDQDFARIIRDDVRTVSLRPSRWTACRTTGATRTRSATTGWSRHDRLPGLPAVPHLRHATPPPAASSRPRSSNRGWPANDAVLHEMLDLRDEQARLLGYTAGPTYDAEVKMVGTVAGDRRVHRAGSRAAADDAGQRDLDMLLARRRQDEPDADDPRRQQLVVLQRARAPRALRRRRAGGAPLLRLRAGARRACSTSPAGCSGSSTAQPSDAPVWHEDVDRLRRASTTAS